MYVSPAIHFSRFTPVRYCRGYFTKGSANKPAILPSLRNINLIEMEILFCVISACADFISVAQKGTKKIEM